MAFSSLNEFFAMGGHAVYVWAAWGVTALLMLVNVVKRRARRENAQRNAQPSHAQPLQEPVNSAQKDVHHDA